MLAKRIGRREGDFGIAMCRCGHLQSDHSSQTVPFGQNGHALREYHHGGCCAGDCHCKQFTFQRFATLDEVADIMIARRETSTFA